ncbi:hypothetical protein P4T04_04745 [Bacillus badius]|nr:hypothetical protein [Bacillus badius]
MIEGIELTVYMQNGENISFDLTPIQAETVFKALGIQINEKSQEMTAFSDGSLKKHILPRINFTPKKE